jgi:glucoamylase
MVAATGLAAPIPLAAQAVAVPGAGAAPGGPGADATFTPADKLGFGTARSTGSPVWFTLQGGRLSEVYYPDLSNPSSRTTELVITDGHGLVERVSQVRTRTEHPDPGVPAYRQTATGTGWEASTRYVTDPAGAAVLMDIEVRSLSGRELGVYLLHDPALSNEGNDDRALPQDGALAATDGKNASALLAAAGFGESTVGYLGVNDGWTELKAGGGRVRNHYSTAGPGNVVQLGRLRLDGTGRTRETVALGFGADPAEAARVARRSLRTGFGSVAQSFAGEWKRYLSGLPAAPGSLRGGHEHDVYTSSVVALACSEDKRNPGAFIASPTMPWAFGFDRELAPEYGSYHLVWPRDQYQIGTGLLAAGDREAAGRALDYLLRVQQPDGHFPQNCTVSGTPYWTSVQLDETAAPMLLAWLLGRHDTSTMDKLVRGADFILGYSKDGYAAPYTEQERWEEQSGYSPSTIAACVAGLVCLADLMRRAGRGAQAGKYLAAADSWRRSVQKWTVTRTGPYSPKPYYTRLTKDGKPDAGTTYDLGNNNTEPADQRSVVDAGFLELVRLGVQPAHDKVITNSLAVVDARIATKTPAGVHWHRYSRDGYGEQANGEPWNVNRDDLQPTYGRLWPIFSGERGEYELLAGDKAAARGRLGDIAATAGGTGLLPEQVWDANPPRVRPGTPTASATPLAWTHAQYVRLAWSVQRGRPVEYPTVVADRYLG